MNSVSSSVSLRALLEDLNRRYPFSSAEPWDRVGLLAGDPDQLVTGVWITQDLSLDQVQQGLAKGCSTFITYHPPFLPGKGPGGGFPSLTSESAVYALLRGGGALITLHTNFDGCAIESLEVISEWLALDKTAPRGRFTSRTSLWELCVWVPSEHLPKVRWELGQAGAGLIGNYTHCAFATSPGTGFYLPLPQAHPTASSETSSELPLGLQSVSEQVLFFQVPGPLRAVLTETLRRVHPYEEPVFHWKKLDQSPSPLGVHRGQGIGIWGDSTLSLSLEAWTDRLWKAFKIPGGAVTPCQKKRPPSAPLRRLGFIPGAGADFLEEAKNLGCDALVTGEVPFHTALAASQQLSVLEVGHAQSECLFGQTLLQALQSVFSFPIHLSLSAQDPFFGRRWVATARFSHA